MKRSIICLYVCFSCNPLLLQGRNSHFDVCLQNGLNMNVEVCTDGIFRIRVTPRSTFSESLMQRYGIIKTDWDPVPVSPKDNKQQFEVSTGAYRLKVDKKTGAISVSDRKGRVIIEKVVFLTSADPLCIELGEVINAKYKDMKVPNNRTIIGDDKNPGNMKDQAETGDYKNTSILSISLKRRRTVLWWWQYQSRPYSTSGRTVAYVDYLPAYRDSDAFYDQFRKLGYFQQHDTEKISLISATTSRMFSQSIIRRTRWISI